MRKEDMELEYWPASTTKENLPTSTKASTKTSAARECLPSSTKATTSTKASTNTTKTSTTTREWLPQAAQDELRGSVDLNGYWEPPYDKMD